MANDLNQCQFIGRVGKIETRYTTEGKAICNISLAVNESWKDKNTGQKQENCEWVRVVIFGKLGEVAEKYVTKGQQLFISGKLKTRKWTDQSGQDRYTTEVIVDQRGQMQMLGGKSEGSTNKPTQNQKPKTEPTPAMDDDFSDDIPF